MPRAMAMIPKKAANRRSQYCFDEAEGIALPDGFHQPDRHRAAHDPGHMKVARHRVGKFLPVGRRD